MSWIKSVHIWEGTKCLQHTEKQWLVVLKYTELLLPSKVNPTENWHIHSYVTSVLIVHLTHADYHGGAENTTLKNIGVPIQSLPSDILGWETDHSKKVNRQINKVTNRRLRKQMVWEMRIIFNRVLWAGLFQNVAKCLSKGCIVMGQQVAMKSSSSTENIFTKPLRCSKDLGTLEEPGVAALGWVTERSIDGVG